LSDDIREFENWRTFIDPVKRAEEFKRLHTIVEESEKELNKRANKLPNDGYWTLFSRTELGPDPTAIQLSIIEQ